ncbi:MAG: hypothetical protein KBA51_01320 [Kiritimatiellae bacterium]|nr:hypothetical protein [Kiritimatiellia bacterium]
MARIRLSLCALLTAAAIGGGSLRAGRPSALPAPAAHDKVCNAVWSGPDQADPGDAVVIARCRGADEYAKTSAGKDWNHHWYLVEMDVLAVERGTWTEKEVRFAYPDAWPTPESGIMIDKAVFPFAKGYILALTLKTGATPATVVAYERRSYVAPHGPLKYIQLKPGKVEPESEYGRIMRAVADFETAHNVAARKAVTDTPEDAGDAWIVHRRDGWGVNSGSWLYRVNKTTFAVQAMP